MVYRDGDQNSFAGLIFQRQDGAQGLNFGSANELRYHWSSSSHWSYNSGLIVPDRTWTFIALVIEPDKATFYLDDGINGMQTISRNSTHAPKEHISYNIGRDTNSGARTATGMLDDVRIINRALSLTEITALSAQGLGARNPIPVNTARITQDFIRLKWTASPLATTQRLYLSTDYSALKQANTGDSSDLGIISENHYDLSNLSPGQYYWRIDTTETNGLTVRGNIWTFEIREDGLLVHLPLDELTTGNPNTTPCLCGGDHDGALTGTPDIAKGVLDNAFEINTNAGNSGRITIPATSLSGLSDQISISFWSKGDTASMPSQNHIFEATSSTGERIVSAHLPWTDSHVYWDAGNNSGYDRINESADTALTEDNWTHWVFTKNANTGEMNIFANGELFRSGTGHTRVFDDPIADFSIGARVNGSLAWSGAIDDFRIYSNALSENSIKSLYRDGLPYYQWAARYYSTFDLQDDSITSPNSGKNLLNYAAQTAPNGTGQLLKAVPDGFELTRIKGGTGTELYKVGDLTYTLLFNTDLSTENWSLDSSLWEEYAPREEGENNTEKLFIRSLIPDLDKIFFRVDVNYTSTP